MQLKVVGIVVSGKLKYFQQCIDAISKQEVPFEKVVVVPWGNEREKIEDFAKKQEKIKIQIVPPSEDSTLEGARNNALYSIGSNPPDWVAFIDDDTEIDSKWLQEMIAAANELGNNYTFASVVTYASKPNIVQGAGHILFEARPLDCAYNHPISAICTSDDPLCPCGNCAFVPWKAIEEISKLDKEIWDPRFRQWQTCFDFGLKLRLVNFGCRLVRSAFAKHEGACGRKKVYSKDDVINQLRSRILLYDKFYPEEERKNAMKLLENAVRRWKKNGYPSAPQCKGNEMEEIFNVALNQEKELKRGMSKVWLRRMEELDERYRRSLLFDGSTLPPP